LGQTQNVTKASKKVISKKNIKFAPGTLESQGVKGSTISDDVPLNSQRSPINIQENEQPKKALKKLREA